MVFIGRESLKDIKYSKINHIKHNDIILEHRSKVLNGKRG